MDKPSSLYQPSSNVGRSHGWPRLLWLRLFVYAKDLLTRLIDPILGIVAYGVLLALLCYLLWRNGLYQDALESYYNPAKTVLLKHVNE